MVQRIALLSYHTCPLAAEEGKETGGMNVYVLNLAKALAVHHHVDIFTRSQDTTQPHIVQIAPNLRLIHVVAGPEKYILPNTDEDKQQLLDGLPEFVVGITALQQKEGTSYDVFDCHYYLSGLAGLTLQEKQPQVPVMMTFHTLALMKGLITRTGITPAEQVRIEAEQEIVKRVEAIISPSENESRYLTALYDADPQKIHTISPGVDTKLFHMMPQQTAREVVGAPLKPKLIMFVGRIEPVKGLDVLLYAMKIMIQKNPKANVCLWLVGENADRSSEIAKLNQLIQILNLHNEVAFIPQQPQGKLPFYYNAADVIVMPSHYESFGLSALEAIACGTPVITTNVMGISTLITDHCTNLISTANNPILLAEQMEHILIKHTERDLLPNVSAFDWKFVAEKIAALIHLLQDTYRNQAQ